MEHTRCPRPALSFLDSVKKFPEAASCAKGGAALMRGAIWHVGYIRSCILCVLIKDANQ